MDAGLLIGRILLVAIFIFSGTVKFVDLSGTAGHIAEQGLPAPMVLAFVAGMVEVVGGLMVAIGWHTTAGRTRACRLQRRGCLLLP